MSGVRTSVTRLLRAGRARRRDERGIALMEMMIAIALTAGVLTIGTSMFISGLRSNAQVVTTTQATMQAQGVGQGIERAVRNARRIKLENCVSGTTDCTKITVWTTLGGERACQVWATSSGANATIQFAQGSAMPGGLADYGAGTDGASVTFGSALLDGAGHPIGVTYAVTYPSETKPVRVTGTVRSRTPYDTTSPTTCGIAA